MKLYFSILLINFLQIQILAQTGSQLTEKQAKEVLDFHNQARLEVGVQDLKWSIELSQYAQKWADHLAKNGCEMEHREVSNYGENLYWTTNGNKITPLDASKAWYSEIHDYKNEPINRKKLHKVGHYTQMVWHDTQKVGMGIATCGNGEMIVVANYDPPGNYLGEKAY